MGAEAGPAGFYAGIIGGVASHMYDNVAETSPSAVAMRKEAKKEATKLRTGEFGASEAQKQGAYAQAASLLAAQQRQQQADLARQQAAGGITGGAAADAQRAIAMANQQQAAKVAGQIQASSDASAQAAYQNALNLVAQQREHGKEFWKRQGDISMQTTQGKAIQGNIGSVGRPANDDEAMLLGAGEA